MSAPRNWQDFKARCRIPAIAAPMFLVSGPDLVVETCNAGLCGTFPALNQRSSEGFEDWLKEIQDRLDDDAAPYEGADAPLTLTAPGWAHLYPTTAAGIPADFAWSIDDYS